MSARGRWRSLNNVVLRVEEVRVCVTLTVSAYGPPYAWVVTLNEGKTIIASGSEKSFGRAKQRALDAALKR